ncbi:MAG: SprT-like family protein [Planctomycetota bacterium]|nr:SprT-like family protein [Planctomycetota bacterium]
MDILAIHNPPETIAAGTTAVRDAAVNASERLRRGDFAAMRAQDLELMFALYDREFFGGWLGERARQETGQDVRFAVSGRMTRAGGKMSHRWRRGPDGRKQYWYEIAISSRLLATSFGEGARPVKVCGLLCPDAMAALQRLMEHEIVHLAEFLAWGESRCGGRRFKVIAARVFGHTDTKHELISPRERAAVEHRVAVGQWVSFGFRGRALTGRINRIHRRATVLVEDARGPRYTDGRRYRKYYVPVHELQPASAKG